MVIYYPRQLVLVTCRGKTEVLGAQKEKDDVLPLSWHSPVSAHPPLYMIAVKKDLMAASIIRKSRCFVVNFVPFTLLDKVKAAINVSGEYLDKPDALGFTEEPCEKLVDCFRLGNALGWLECEVQDIKERGDHILFIGKVLYQFLDHDDRRPFRDDGNRFTTTSD